MGVLEEVAQEITPSEEDEKKVTAIADAVIHKIQEQYTDAKVLLGGSGAKGTWLKDTFDIDLFVAFAYEQYAGKSDQLSDILEKKLSAFSPERFHGSRDYFRFDYKGYTFEVVPILAIKKAAQAKNITDISPLHAQWVNKKSTAVLKKDIRLAKQFMKAQGLYGAESYIQGFSGYVIEILVIHYDGFLNFLKQAQRWKVQEVVDTASHHEDVFFEVNSSKLNSLIVIDPVQAGRNAAAALSEAHKNAFVALAKRFLKTPQASFFQKQPVNLEKLKKQKHTLVVEVMPLPGKEDVVGCQLAKVFHYVAQQLEHYGFTIKQAVWGWEENAYFVFTLATSTLSSEKIIQGPPVTMKEHAERFRKKYKSVEEKKGKLVATAKRKYVNASVCMEAIVQAAYVQERIKEVL